MSFVYILLGWEGSAHNGRVLSDAQNRYSFDTPKGKYWLGDAGYGNSKYIMSPYRGVRYYLKEQRQADLRPNTAKELFNLRYASLRNVIKRIFGVVKRKFKVLGSVAEYSINTQIHLVLALIALYNFICLQEDIQEDIDKIVQDKNQEIDEDILEGNFDTRSLGRSTLSKMDERRDKIAEDM